MTPSTLTLPGLIDAHVHLREPGATHKEDIRSGTAAALAGGVIGVLDMPNNNPPIVDAGTFGLKEALFRKSALCDYGLFLGFDGQHGFDDQHLEPFAQLAERAVGLKLYLDQTYGAGPGRGTVSVGESPVLPAIFEAWPGPAPIAIHAESDSLPRALELARRYRQRLHVCHVPHPDDLLRIDQARQRGTAVTCEVTPHHLFLSREVEARLGAYARMKPPLVSTEDVARFWERLDLVDIIASDHAPHTRAEKESASPPPGVPGLETTLPLLLRAVDEGRLTLERMIELTWRGPLRVYGLRPPPDSGIEVEIDAPYSLPADGYRTRCGWSPYAGESALGRVIRVRLRGRTVWEEGRVLAKPGDGRPLERGGPTP